MCLGIPGQLVDIVDLSEHRAIADVDGVRREINVNLVEGEPGGIKVGDWVLIHVGFAMSRIDEEEAARTLSFIKELGSLYDDELAQFAAGGAEIPMDDMGAPLTARDDEPEPEQVAS